MAEEAVTSERLAQYRFPELDLLRTLAIAMMIAYHIAYDLWAYFGWQIHPRAGAWWLLARSTAVLFLLLVGTSFVIASQRKPNRRTVTMNAVRRGSIVLGGGILVTVATYFFDSGTYVRFGILHCIGVSMMLLPLVQRCKEWNLLIGTLLIILSRGADIPQDTGSSFLIPFGFPPPHFVSVDYFPLLPWFGVILLGAGLGHLLYVRTGRTPPVTVPPLVSMLGWPGRRALFIYLLHQPIILAMLWMLL